MIFINYLLYLDRLNQRVNFNILLQNSFQIMIKKYEVDLLDLK